MQTNQSPNDNIRDAARAYGKSITVPPYDERAIRARVRTAPARPRWVRSFIAIAAAAAVLFLVLDGRNVVAQVEHMFRAFVSVNGVMVAAGTDAVTLDRARRDVPFTVIAPAGLPAGLQGGEITEVVPPAGSAEGRHIFFRYETPQGQISIDESRPSRAVPSSGYRTAIANFQGAENPGIHGLPPYHGPGTIAYYRSSTGKLQVVHPATWTVDGTTIVLMAPPGILTSQQIALIERSMH